MRPSELFVIAAFGALVTPALTCAHHLRRQDTGADSPFFFPASCEPNALTLEGYSLNHFSIITKNLTASMEFYTKAVGLTHLFTFSPVKAPFFKLVYLGHNTGINDTTPTSGKPFATCEDFTNGKNSIKGLIEILHVEKAQFPLISSSKVVNTFSHVGLIVPNVTETEARMRKLGVRIVKPVGELPVFDGPVANGFGIGPLSIPDITDDQKEGVLEGLRYLGFDTALIAMDPDDNLVEMQNELPVSGL